MVNKMASKDEGTTNALSQEQNDDKLVRCHRLRNREMSAAHEWAKRLNAHAEPTIGALLVWARHTREAGRWLASSMGLNDGEDKPKEAANIDFLEGSYGSIWQHLSEVIYERTGFPSDGIELNELAIMAECGSAVHGRDDLKVAYRRFISAAGKLDVVQLIGDLQVKFPVATADLPRPPVKGEWSIWMNKGEVEEILKCDGRYFEDLYPSEIESRGRKQWRFRLDVRDEQIRKRYADCLSEHRSKK